MGKDDLEIVPKAMMDDLNRFKKYDFTTAMALFHNGAFPAIDYYRCTQGLDNDYNAFLKILKHLNGDPQFKAEKPKKYVVQSKVNLAFSFLAVYEGSFMLVADQQSATLFDTREEAEKWTNPQTEVIEVEE